MTLSPVSHIWIKSLAIAALSIGSCGSLLAQDGFQQQPKQLTSTFVDPNSGQQYGRYIIYESVPVVSYEQQEQVDRVWVPEWVTEQKQTTQASYVPIVTYQLQLQTEQTLNPFVQPRQFWQYVPVVQYQAQYRQVSQPVTYQKYVQKDVKKIIPVLVTQTRQVPKFADLPLQPQSTTTASNVQPGTVPPQAMVAQVPTPQYYPTTLGASVPAQPNIGQPNVGQPNVAAVPPAYNANNGGWNGANPWIASRQMGGVAAAPINNPTPNAGVAGYGYQQPYIPQGYGTVQPNYASVSNRPTFQWPQFMTQAGSIFPGGLFRNNQNAGTQYVATNPTPMGNGAWLPSPVGTYSGTSYSGTSSSGATFIPNSPSTGSYNNGSNWNVVPINNYRDPTQTGIPANVLR